MGIYLLIKYLCMELGRVFKYLDSLVCGYRAICTYQAVFTIYGGDSFPLCMCLFHIGKEINDSPIEQVRVTVPITDDNTQPALTIRTWVLGLVSCLIQGFMKAFFSYRQNQLYISSFCTQIVVLPLGKLMAATLPTNPVRIPGTKWSFSMNPGPFSMKEHALISIFASTGSESPTVMAIATTIKAYYHRKVNPLAFVLMTISSQLMGYGFAGLLMRTLHEPEVRPKRQLTRMQFFLIVLVCSFAYYIVPNYFFPSITALSLICLIWKDSVTAQQIGAGRNGLGLGSFGFDWATMTLDPLVTPMFSLNNSMAGFVVFFYILTPIAYWTNTYDAKRFPIFSSHVYDSDGHKFNVSRVLDPKGFTLDQEAYKDYSKMHLSIFYAFAYGCFFASISATFTHVVVFYGRSIWSQIKETYGGSNTSGDVHARLMKKYKQVPSWWFYTILILTVALGIFISRGFDRELQLAYWVIPSASILGLLLTLINGVLPATANQSAPVTIVPELIMGYVYPGRPLANMIFKNYCTESMGHATWFLRDFKFGHYMKIPPKSMFIVQVIGTLIGSLVNFDVTTIWGILGPGRLFAPHGIYSNMYLFIILGVVTTLMLWMFTHAFPEKKWLKLIYVPIIFSTIAGMPPGRPVEIWSSWIVGILYYLIVYKKFNGWWAKYTYVLANGLSAGPAFMAILTYFTLQLHDINGLNWWGLELDDHCPLAHCPTAVGSNRYEMLVEGYNKQNTVNLETLHDERCGGVHQMVLLRAFPKLQLDLIDCQIYIGFHHYKNDLRSTMSQEVLDHRDEMKKLGEDELYCSCLAKPSLQELEQMEQRTPPR
ncbi:hypothetical protein HHK36_032951 [Tetracentron sinense]|uniref:Uncharacterized protein n=1 Tax=Tetracentron sinense TaxID=13715 RepID=A0A834Y6W0_TETSI|nr:hypothetical protein HHK36_032951 [Tetracentron sinense]